MEMKRTWVSVAIFLAFMTAFFIIGCGGGGTGENEYQTLLKKAKSIFNSAETKWKDLEERLQKVEDNTTKVVMAAMSGNLSGFEPGKSPGLADAAKALLPDIDSLKAEYQGLIDPKMEEYKGVDSYVKYAKEMIQALDIQKNATLRGVTFLEKLDPLIAAGNVDALKSTVDQSIESGEVGEIQKLQKEAKDAFDKAKEIKEEQRLGT